MRWWPNRWPHLNAFKDAYHYQLGDKNLRKFCLPFFFFPLTNVVKATGSRIAKLTMINITDCASCSHKYCQNVWSGAEGSHWYGFLSSNPCLLFQSVSVQMVLTKTQPSLFLCCCIHHLSNKGEKQRCSTHDPCKINLHVLLIKRWSIEKTRKIL